CRKDDAVPSTKPALSLTTGVASARLLRDPAQAATSRPKSPAPATESRPTIRFREAGPDAGVDLIHMSGNGKDKYYPTGTGSGVALIDYDADGRLHVYLATTRNLPLDAPTTSRVNRLYRNRGDGTFEDVTKRAGVGFRGFCHGVVAGDVDNN